MAFNVFENFLGGPLRGLGLEPQQLPLVGGFFGNPAADAKVQALEDAARQYEAYRPQVAAARLNALRQALGGFGATNQMVQQMTGFGAPPMPTDPFAPGGGLASGAGGGPWMGNPGVDPNDPSTWGPGPIPTRGTSNVTETRNLSKQNADPYEPRSIDRGDPNRPRTTARPARAGQRSTGHRRSDSATTFPVSLDAL